MSLWNFILAWRSSSLLSRDWTWASRMLGKGAQCARALSLFLMPACFPQGLILTPRLLFSLRISVGHLGSGVTDGLSKAWNPVRLQVDGQGAVPEVKWIQVCRLLLVVCFNKVSGIKGLLAVWTLYPVLKGDYRAPSSGHPTYYPSKKLQPSRVPSPQSQSYTQLKSRLLASQSTSGTSGVTSTSRQPVKDAEHGSSHGAVSSLFANGWQTWREQTGQSQMQGSSAGSSIASTSQQSASDAPQQSSYYGPLPVQGAGTGQTSGWQSAQQAGQSQMQRDLSWSRHTNSLAKKARQRLYHLRRLRDFRRPSKVLQNFYTCTIESILMGNITVWFGNSTKQDRQALQSVVRSAVRITHTEHPDLQTIYYKRRQTKARKIVKDPTHPNNRLFSLLRSGRRFHSLKTKTERLKRSFFPQAIRALNQGN
ncbi:hypothetical protein P4O66_003095 [Electrophorus voltai]|uniref:Alkylated DNA repair protein AlkB homologue 8 N-terminal domain-containing protein n=1 Tax=Electrophorus voltai TaxID=2609070 RepID=A0AAD8YV91_9TELE|nr:hypothetical protein P4O66_003095 [Electrophorus voltai]